MPIWLYMLTAPALTTNAQEFVCAIGRFHVVPNAQVQHVASAVRLMLHSLKVPEAVTMTLRSHLSNPQALVGAI